jgi:hypothetical protein
VTPAAGRRPTAAVLAIVACLASWAAPARDVGLVSAPVMEMSAGAFGILDGSDESSDALNVGAEYRWRSMGRWSLAPALGISGAGDGSSYIYASVRRDFWMDSRWVMHLSFGAGRFSRGDVLDLGGSLEFQSAVGLAHRFRGGWLLGISVQHLSNGGLFDENPGTEVALLQISRPIDQRRSRPYYQSTTADPVTPAVSANVDESAIDVASPSDSASDAAGG